MDQRAVGERDALLAAREALPAEAHACLSVVKTRVAQDRLPLLSLLETKPLQVQSSHLSFQEYFAMRAICEGSKLPSEVERPWQWEAWWANTVKLGSQTGDAFGRGLLRACGQTDTLDLEGKLGGDRPTALAAVAELMRAAASIR